MNKWLFLRGEWDERTQKSIDDNDDMWFQLFEKLHNDDFVRLWFKGQPLPETVDYIFTRGGFDYYLPVLKKYPTAYKIRYGAGKRFMPESDIDYNLVLVDTEEQKQQVKEVYPDCNVHKFIKPAAQHFRVIPEIRKEFDVCYIANGQQSEIKSIQWVYETVPKHIKVLHLGYPSKYTPPENVTCLRVDRINMPEQINRCSYGIVPYWSGVDSCPRVIPEMLACGLPIVVGNKVNFWRERYLSITSSKEDFWKTVQMFINKQVTMKSVDTYYNDNLSIKKSVDHLKSLIYNNK